MSNTMDINAITKQFLAAITQLGQITRVETETPTFFNTFLGYITSTIQK